MDGSSAPVNDDVGVRVVRRHAVLHLQNDFLLIKDQNHLFEIFIFLLMRFVTGSAAGQQQ